MSMDEPVPGGTHYQGLPIVHRYGPAMVTMVGGGGGYSEAMPWALLLRDGPQQLLGVRGGPFPEIQPIGKVIKKEDGLILFKNPEGPIVLVVEMWRTEDEFFHGHW